MKFIAATVMVLNTIVPKVTFIEALEKSDIIK